MTMMQNSKGEGARVLFFGRNKCDYSQALLSKLKIYGFDVTYIKSKGRGENLPEDIMWWEGEYIICFRSLFILPNTLIKKAKVAAINFHPAPPEYPGSGCVNFALYDGVDEYGVTAHIMNEKVDNGEIIEVRRFPVNKLDNLRTVLSRTQSDLFHLCSDFINSLAVKGKTAIQEKKNLSKNEHWKGNARLMSELEALQNINPNVSKEELQKIIRATYIEGFPPKIEIHGYSFYLNLEV